MSKLTGFADLGQIADLPTLVARITPVLQDIHNKVNGKLDMATNFNGKQVTVKFTAANTDQPVTHGLGRVATNYHVVSKSASCDVFNGKGTATASTLYLQCTQPNVTVTLVIF